MRAKAWSLCLGDKKEKKDEGVEEREEEEGEGAGDLRW